ncbi:hypothetical protein [Lysinibacillus sphaericus]|uniref:hypothetical protein n=1 Tax=Lysinibacillus sphaericus TaxID=1421 RepID=UPI003D74D5FD
MVNIHTAHLLVTLTPSYLATKTQRYGKNKSFNAIMREHNIKGIKARQYFTREANIPKCSIIIDVTQILQRGDVYEKDYPIIKAFIKNCLGIVYGDSDLYYNHNLVRIDYRLDRVVKDPKHRRIYLLLYHKTRQKYMRLIKSSHEVYRSSIYHKNGSLETILYDKNLEAAAKNRNPEPWEQDVLRFEVRLKNSHIFNLCKRTGEKKCLFNFFNENRYKEYLQKYLFNIYPTGDFYNFAYAEKIIEQSSKSLTIKRRLKDFFKKVSNGNLDSPMSKNYKGSISKDTWRTRIKIFNSMNVNPITIPQTYKIDFLPSLLH